MAKAKATHTPGPWEFVLDDDGVTSGVTFIVRMGSHLRGKNGWQPQHRIEYEVSSKQESPNQFAEAKANARLIAAAPELLAALKEAAQFAASAVNPSSRLPNYEQACVAIARAEGH